MLILVCLHRCETVGHVWTAGGTCCLGLKISSGIIYTTCYIGGPAEGAENIRMERSPGALDTINRLCSISKPPASQKYY